MSILLSDFLSAPFSHGSHNKRLFPNLGVLGRFGYSYTTHIPEIVPRICVGSLEICVCTCTVEHEHTRTTGRKGTHQTRAEVESATCAAPLRTTSGSDQPTARCPHRHIKAANLAKTKRESRVFPGFRISLRSMSNRDLPATRPTGVFLAFISIDGELRIAMGVSTPMYRQVINVNGEQVSLIYGTVLPQKRNYHAPKRGVLLC